MNRVKKRKRSMVRGTAKWRRRCRRSNWIGGAWQRMKRSTDDVVVSREWISTSPSVPFVCCLLSWIFFSPIRCPSGSPFVCPALVLLLLENFLWVNFSSTLHSVVHFDGSCLWGFALRTKHLRRMKVMTLLHFYYLTTVSYFTCELNL